MQIGSLETAGYPHKTIDLMIRKLQEVTAAQVQEVAKKYLVDDSLTVAVLDPQPLAGRKPAAAPKDCAMRNKRLRPGCAAGGCVMAAPAYALLPIQHWQTKNGARVYFVENRDLPMLDVSVDFPAGSAFDTREKIRACCAHSAPAQARRRRPFGRRDRAPHGRRRRAASGAASTTTAPACRCAR